MGDIRDALATDEALREAASVALARAERGDGTVSWADVSDAVAAEQWGRLLERDVLVATGDGFVIADPDAVRAVAQDSDGDDRGVAGEAGTEVDGWSTADKVASVAAVGLMASYQAPVARDAIGSTVNVFLGPLEAALPFGVVVALLAVATTLVTTTVRSRLTDGVDREALSERMDRVSERLAAARERGDEAAVERLETRRQALLREQFGQLKSMVRPMVWTVLVTAPVFLWLSWLAINPAAAITPAVQVLPVAGRVVWTARIAGPVQVWTVWYLVCSVASNVLGKRAVRRVRPVVTGRVA